MSDVLTHLFVFIASIIVGAAIGMNVQAEVTAKDCDTLGKFRQQGTVYVCNREKP